MPSLIGSYQHFLALLAKEKSIPSRTRCASRGQAEQGTFHPMKDSCIQ
jgi:hypothetical protein